jgi:trk system potassium uptake protein TrkH
MSKLPFQIRPISKILGALHIMIGLLMLLCLPSSFHYHAGDHKAIMISSAITIISGILLSLIKRNESTAISKREGYLIVALGWLTMVLFGMLPFLFSGVIPNVMEAFFETVSGMTTTGATILEDIESVPKGILFWRSMTQWIGGMGIIVLTVAIFPLLGIGGIELFVAEAPGPTSDKLHPRIKETAKRLWFIYVGLTGLLSVLLYFEGMNVYDAMNHAFTTMATGGFSTKNASMAHYTSPLIQYTIIIFMVFAGTNYTVIYFGLLGKFRRVWASEEFRAYLSVLAILTLIIGFTVWGITEAGMEKSFRDALFQVVSLVTTTGFVTADYTQWGSSMTMLCFLIMFLGASAGSTSGGIKIVRHMVFFKNTFLEFKRILHPRAIIRIKINGEVVAPRILTHILVFLLVYLALFISGTFLLATLGIDFKTSAGAVATSLGNVGPGIGSVGPLDNFAHLPISVKTILGVLMLLGRLELFTILILFTPYFWRNN